MTEPSNGKARWSYTRFCKKISDESNSSIVSGKYDSQLAAKSYFDVNELYVAAAALDAAIDQLLGLLAAQVALVSDLPSQAGHHPQGHQILCDGLGRVLADSGEFAPGWEVERVVDESARHLTGMLGRAPGGLPRTRLGIVAIGRNVVDSQRVDGTCGRACTRQAACDHQSDQRHQPQRNSRAHEPLSPSSRGLHPQLLIGTDDSAEGVPATRGVCTCRVYPLRRIVKCSTQARGRFRTEVPRRRVWNYPCLNDRDKEKLE